MRFSRSLSLSRSLARARHCLVFRVEAICTAASVLSHQQQLHHFHIKYMRHILSFLFMSPSFTIYEGALLPMLCACQQIWRFKGITI